MFLVLRSVKILIKVKKMIDMMKFLKGTKVSYLLLRIDERTLLTIMVIVAST